MLERRLPRRVLTEVRWSFTWPCTWLAGVFVNLGLSLAWLALVPLRGRQYGDWVILLGSYFAEFILADVTTTNVLGLDATRVRASLASGVSVRRLLASKNWALLVIVGLPTLAMTALLTLRSELPYRLVLTLPGVALPILTWLGVGNVVSVVLPVAVRSLRTRWQQRRDWRSTLLWLGHLGLPYLLLYGVDPIEHAGGAGYRLLPAAWDSAELEGSVLLATGLLFWGLGTWLATRLVSRYGLRMY